MKQESCQLFNQKNSVIRKSHRQYGLTHVAKRNFVVGETVLMSWGQVIDHQTKHISIQVSRDQHILPGYFTGRNFNHACDPNCRIQTRKDGLPNLVARQKIYQGDEITFAYWMTEYCWSKIAAERKIDCLCGTRNCTGVIRSFIQLTKTEQLKNKGLISDYLQNEM